MYQTDITPMTEVWQTLLIQTQELAASLPETGLNPDKLTSLPLDDLVGTLAFLKCRKAEQEA